MPAALLLAFLVVRVALVQAFAGRDPGKAEAAWPSHPNSLLDNGLAEVGELAASGKAIGRSRIAPLLAVSTKAPLAPEPFLVRGIEAQLAGDPQLALRAFLAARQRNPRAIAARYFLADHYLKAGRVGPGLGEVSALARLLPQSLPTVAPFLAAYARTPGVAPQVKAMLQEQPQLETALLDDLAADPGNLDLMLYLWSGRSGDAARPWQARLLNGLAEAGRFVEARRAWSRLTGISGEPDRLFDAEFLAQAPPPFGWTLASGPAGFAEPQQGGRLHALFYGREDVVLARQTLTLPPGSYRLSMRVRGASAATRSLFWRFYCLPFAGERVVDFASAKNGVLTLKFAVPQLGCTAQRLEMDGAAPEVPELVDVTIGELGLQREDGT